MRVLARPRVLRGDDALYYLMRVLRNTFLTGRRAAARRPRTGGVLEEIPTADNNPTLRPDEALEIQELYSTIAGLPDKLRLAIVAVDVLGLSYREAAKALGTREATVTTRLFRARKRVVELLGEDGSREPASNPPLRARDDREPASPHAEDSSALGVIGRQATE